MIYPVINLKITNCVFPKDTNFNFNTCGYEISLLPDSSSLLEKGEDGEFLSSSKIKNTIFYSNGKRIEDEEILYSYSEDHNGMGGYHCQRIKNTIVSDLLQFIPAEADIRKYQHSYPYWKLDRWNDEFHTQTYLLASALLLLANNSKLNLDILEITKVLLSGYYYVDNKIFDYHGKFVRRHI